MEDQVLEEMPLALEVDGYEEARVILTSGDEVYWGLGHLACRGMISSMEDVSHVAFSKEKISISRSNFRKGINLSYPCIHTASTRLLEEQGVLLSDREALPVRGTVDFSVLIRALDKMKKATLFAITGSVHVALLVSLQGKILYLAEDVGRHNAVDKAVGWGIYHGLDLGSCFLAVSGRLPADMVYKAIGSGIPLLISVSAVTASGIDAAERGGVTLIGFAREGRMNVYTFPERLRGFSGSSGATGTWGPVDGQVPREC